MKLSADHIFNIGSQHLRSGTPCQDYALSGEMNGGVYAVVSDGCSTGNRTDVGARVIALSTARALVACAKAGRMELDRVQLLQSMMMDSAEMALDLEFKDLLATRALAFANKLHAVAHIAGDGVVAARYRDGQIIMTRVDWANNAPFYPIYRDETRKRFIKAFEGDAYAKAAIWETVCGVHSSRVDVPLPDAIEGVTVNFDPRELETLAVFSDGVTQVDGIEWHEAVRQLLDFKTPVGEFAKRRMHGFLRNARDVGKGPIDDIAYAVIHFEPETA